MRRTKIVCTIGPATRSQQRIRALIQAGMNIARLNFSHGSFADHAETIALVREVAAELHQPIALLQDLPGPKIRVGELVGGRPVPLQTGTEVTLTTRPIIGQLGLIPVTYPDLAKDLQPGERILLADGAIELVVLGTNETDVRCRVVHGGLLSEHKGVNLPGAHISAPSLTETDAHALAFGLEHGVDYVAVSFVRTAEDVRSIIGLIRSRGYATPVIAKLEKPEAIDNLPAILATADCVMVARGDLGVEVPLECVPILQKRIIQAANESGVPVITATQMLESMITSPRPTRAEASDIANAVFDGTDALMLSAETAIGEFPVESVQMMDRVARAAEQSAALGQSLNHIAPQHFVSVPHAFAHAAVAVAQDLAARALVVFTRSGYTAKLISKFRPPMPVIVVTPVPEVARRAALYWGTEPVVVPTGETAEAVLASAEKGAIQSGLVKAGDTVVVVARASSTISETTNMLKIHRISTSGLDAERIGA